jgi:para-nitrobenzyl esterase
MRNFIAAMLLLAGVAMTAQAAPVVTSRGPVTGIFKNGVTRYLGIAYAAPPVGKLRWMPPQPPAKWTAVKQAVTFGPTCAQVTTLGPFAGPANANEDCLYLNVFAPHGAKNLPVLVWLHGGGYVDGESNDYDAGKLAAQGKLVVVTINYRLGLFGFLAVPALDSEGHPFGNYGVLDMQAALRWVHDNITAFGGDPRIVTLGGQSAGAGAAAANVVSPGAAGLFQRAIFQSGGYTPFATLKISEERGAKFAAAAGCTTGDISGCLRALPASRIIALSGTAAANGPFINGPLVDGTVIPHQMIDAVTSGAFNRMPVMIGTTKDEANFGIGIAEYFRRPRVATSAADFRNIMKSTYGGNAGPGGDKPAYAKSTVESVIAHYPMHGAAQASWSGAATDNLACRGQTLAGAMAPHVPVYMYEFDDRTAPSYFPRMPGYASLAYHTGDIGYVFTGYHGGPQGLPTALNPAQTKLSDRLIAAWANFARSGNPNASDDTPWPRWKADGAAYFLEDDSWNKTQTNAAFAAAHQCGLWRGILLYR